MIEGDPENVDAQYRTEFSVKALTDAGWEVNELDDQVGMWDQVKGAELVANSLSQYGNDIEEADEMVKRVSDRSAEIIYSYDNAPFRNMIISRPPWRDGGL